MWQKSLVFVAVFTVVSMADIGLIYSDGSRAVVFYDGNLGQTVFQLCDKSSNATGLDRTCSRVGSSYQKSYTEFLTNVHQLFKIDPRFQGPQGLNSINQEIESLQRDKVNPDLAGTPGLKKVVEDLDSLQGTQKILLKVKNRIEAFLWNTPATNVVMREGIHPFFLPLIYAFHNIWYDGQSTLWRVGPQVKFSEQTGACGPGWQQADEQTINNSRNLKYPAGTLADSPIGRTVGMGWSVWTNRKMSPMEYHDGGSWSMYEPYLGIAMSVGPVAAEDNSPGYHSYTQTQGRGRLWDLVDLESPNYVLCLTSNLGQSF